VGDKKTRLETLEEVYEVIRTNASLALVHLEIQSLLEQARRDARREVIK